jgi:hypothetical protein
MAGRQVSCRSVRLRTIKEHRPTFGTGSQGIEEKVCSIIVVRKQRADLEAHSTCPDDAVASNCPILDQHQSIALSGAQPAPQERVAGSREEGAIIRNDGLLDPGTDGSEPGVTNVWAMGNAAEAYVPVSKYKPRSLVIFLLGDDTVEADNAAPETRHPCPPETKAVSPPAQFGLHDVESEEAEAGAVCNDRDAADRFTPADSDQEALLIGGMKTISIGKTGIPPLPRGPLDHKFEVTPRHGPDL